MPYCVVFKLQTNETNENDYSISSSSSSLPLLLLLLLLLTIVIIVNINDNNNSNVKEPAFEYFLAEQIDSPTETSGLQKVFLL